MLEWIHLSLDWQDTGLWPWDWCWEKKMHWKLYLKLKKGWISLFQSFSAEILPCNAFKWHLPWLIHLSHSGCYKDLFSVGLVSSVHTKNSPLSLEPHAQEVLFFPVKTETCYLYLVFSFFRKVSGGQKISSSDCL